MPSEPRPAIPSDRGAPVVRGRWCWPALAVGAALVLDGIFPLLDGNGPLRLLWIDLAALGCLAWALAGARRPGERDWSTPLDGRIASGFVLAVLHVFSVRGAEEPVLWLRQIAAVGVCYYTLGARLRRDAHGPDAIWPVFAGVSLSLSAWVLVCLARGPDVLRAASQAVDASWASRFGLAKTLLLVTILCAGRASEVGQRVLWRAITALGVAACGVCLVVGGMGLGVSSLASLDEPFYFGTSVVAVLFLASLSRMSWELARDRPEEAGRWRAAAVAFPLVVLLLLFGGTTGGEGVRVITALGGAIVIAARIAPRAAAATPATAPVRAKAGEPPEARAA